MLDSYGYECQTVCAMVLTSAVGEITGGVIAVGVISVGVISDGEISVV